MFPQKKDVFHGRKNGITRG